MGRKAIGVALGVANFVSGEAVVAIGVAFGVAWPTNLHFYSSSMIDRNRHYVFRSDSGSRGRFSAFLGEEGTDEEDSGTMNRVIRGESLETARPDCHGGEAVHERHGVGVRGGSGRLGSGSCGSGSLGNGSGDAGHLLE